MKSRVKQLTKINFSNRLVPSRQDSEALEDRYQRMTEVPLKNSGFFSSEQFCNNRKSLNNDNRNLQKLQNTLNDSFLDEITQKTKLNRVLPKEKTPNLKSQPKITSIQLGKKQYRNQRYSIDATNTIGQFNAIDIKSKQNFNRKDRQPHMFSSQVNFSNNDQTRQNYKYDRISQSTFFQNKQVFNVKNNETNQSLNRRQEYKLIRKNQQNSKTRQSIINSPFFIQEPLQYVSLEKETKLLSNNNQTPCLNIKIDSSDIQNQLKSKIIKLQEQLLVQNKQLCESNSKIKELQVQNLRVNKKYKQMMNKYQQLRKQTQIISQLQKVNQNYKLENIGLKRTLNSTEKQVLMYRLQNKSILDSYLCLQETMNLQLSKFSQQMALYQIQLQNYQTLQQNIFIHYKQLTQIFGISKQQYHDITSIHDQVIQKINELTSNYLKVQQSYSQLQLSLKIKQKQIQQFQLASKILVQQKDERITIMNATIQQLQIFNTEKDSYIIAQEQLIEQTNTNIMQLQIRYLNQRISSQVQEDSCGTTDELVIDSTKQ